MKVIYTVLMNYVTSKDGTKISFLKAGSGPTVLLVGGALQSKSDPNFAKLTSLLAREFTVMSYDRRGRGESDKTQASTVQSEVDDLNALIDSVEGSVALFGNSSGGHLALRTALANPKVARVAIYEAPFIPEQEAGSADAYIKSLREMVARDDRDAALKLFLKRVGVPGFALFIMRILPIWVGLRKLAPSLLNDAMLVGDGSIPAEFKSIKAKALILSGSTPRMVEASKNLASVIPEAQFKILKGQTHAVKPEVLGEALLAFLRG